MPPLRFHPILKRLRWGGRRLGTVLGKPLGEHSDYAESWEVADHGRDQSTVAGGPWSGWTLGKLVRERGEPLLGPHAGRGQFPLLVKLLDARDRLSVQVHPDDAQARRFDPDENGKTEAWVVLEAEAGGRLFAGLKEGVDRPAFERHVAAGTVEACLHSFPAQPGDCVFVPAGTVHAIGEGILLAEVQQSSDLTFRLHDWGRVGTDGRPRPLHVDQALACIDFRRGPVQPVVPQVVSAGDPQVEELVRCDHFALRRHTARVPFVFPPAGRCRILTFLEGAARLVSKSLSGKGDRHPTSCGGTDINPQHPGPSPLFRTGCNKEGMDLSRGATVLLPAAAAATEILPAGRIVLLESYVP